MTVSASRSGRLTFKGHEPPTTKPLADRVWNRAWGGLAIAAALVAAFALGNAWNLTEPSDYAFLADSAVAQEVHMLDVAMAPDVTSMPMTGKQGEQSLIYSPIMGEGVLVVQGTAEPDPDTVYQIWLTDSAGQPHAMASFRPDPNGEATVMLEGGLADAKSVTITMEPGPGATRPSLPVVASAEIA